MIENYSQLFGIFISMVVHSKMERLEYLKRSFRSPKAEAN